MHPQKLIKENSSIILTSAAGVGTIATAYLSARASFQACRLIDLMEAQEGVADSHENQIRDRFWRVWRLYIPAAAVGSTTIAALIAGKRVDHNRILATQAGLAVCQRAYSQYRDAVIEEFGDRKDQALRAKVAEKQVAENPPSAIVVGSGTVPCCELWTMRYFMADKQALAKAVNEVNARILKHDYATMDDFYYELGLEYTHSSGHSGWDSSRLLELEFSSILHQDQPYLAFEYNYVKSF